MKETIEEAAKAYISEKYIQHSLIDLLIKEEAPIFIAGANRYKQHVLEVIDEKIKRLDDLLSILPYEHKLITNELKHLKQLLEE